MAERSTTDSIAMYLRLPPEEREEFVQRNEGISANTYHVVTEEPLDAETYVRTLQSLGKEEAELSAQGAALGNVLLRFPVGWGVATFQGRDNKHYSIRRAGALDEEERPSSEMSTLYVSDEQCNITFEAGVTHYLATGATRLQVNERGQLPMVMSHHGLTETWHYLPSVRELPTLTPSRLLAVSVLMHTYAGIIQAAGPDLLQQLQKCVQETRHLCAKAHSHTLSRSMGGLVYHAEINSEDDRLKFTLESSKNRLSDASTEIHYRADPDDDIILHEIKSDQLDSDALRRLQYHLTGNMLSRILFEYFNITPSN